MKSIHSRKISISIIILTRDRSASLKRTLKSLIANTEKVKNYEIIVVDNMSKDDTKVVAKQFGVKYVYCPLPGVSMCRQKGINEANGDIILMLDDDCVPQKNWMISFYNRLLNDTKLALVGGHIINVGFSKDKEYKGRGKIGKNGVSYFVKDPKEADYYGSANIALRKSAVLCVGGYDPMYRTGGYEEIDLITRLKEHGFKVDYEPYAVVYHHYVKTNYRHSRLLYSGPLPRLYFYFKFYRPRNLKQWLDFIKYESGLFRENFTKRVKALIWAFLHLNSKKIKNSLILFINMLFPYIALLWVMAKGYNRRKLEKYCYTKCEVNEEEV